MFGFDMQGEIRYKFEQDKIKSDTFFKQYYPAAINPGAYQEKIQRKLDEIYSFLEDKYEIENLESQLEVFNVIDVDVCQADSISFVGSVPKKTDQVNGFRDISDNLDNIAEQTETIMRSPWFAQVDANQLATIIKQLKDISERYKRKRESAEFDNTKIALFQDVINKFKQENDTSITDIQKKISNMEVLEKSQKE